MTFSFNPAMINDGGLNQIRFELGDVLVEQPEKTAYLSDESILAALEGSPTFKRAKFRLLESLLHRFAYEVTTEIHEVKWTLSDRFKAWQDLYKRLKAELEAEDMAGTFGFAGKNQRPPIFRVGLHDRR